MKDQIITFLKRSEGYFSGEEISRQLDISRTAVWKNIEELRKDGYDIAAAPHLGYKLKGLPDKLFPREIHYGLKSKSIGRTIIYFESVDTTMKQAFALGIDGAETGTVVCAETQTQGKGRLGRSWNSPKGGGIYLSVILRPQLSLSQIAQYTLLSAVAVREAIAEVTGIPADIKWPNDLLVKNKKVAGILTEMNAEMDRVKFIVVGIGINVNTALRGLPPNATSLKSEARKQISRVALVRAIFHAFERWETVRTKEGFAPVIAKWKEYSSTIGKRVRMVDAGGRVEGRAIGLNEHGGLLIRSDSGKTISRITGDVIQVG